MSYTSNPDPAIYKVCLERGHQPTGEMLASCPPWNVCKHCRVAYRFETLCVELGMPPRDLATIYEYKLGTEETSQDDPGSGGPSGILPYLM